MAFCHKYSYEKKERILMEYLNGTHGFRELCRVYGMSPLQAGKSKQGGVLQMASQGKSYLRGRKSKDRRRNRKDPYGKPGQRIPPDTG